MYSHNNFFYYQVQVRTLLIQLSDLKELVIGLSYRVTDNSTVVNMIHVAVLYGIISFRFEHGELERIRVEFREEYMYKLLLTRQEEGSEGV